MPQDQATDHTQGTCKQANIEQQSLRDLQIKRSSIKGQITKFRNYLQLIYKKPSLSTAESAELSLKLGKFEALSLRFDDLQDRIEVLNSTNLSSEIDERENIEHAFITHIVI